MMQSKISRQQVMHRKSMEIRSQRQTDGELHYRRHKLSCECHEKQAGKLLLGSDCNVTQSKRSWCTGRQTLSTFACIPHTLKSVCAHLRYQPGQTPKNGKTFALYLNAGSWDGVISKAASTPHCSHTPVSLLQPWNPFITKSNNSLIQSVQSQVTLTF